LQKFLNEGTYNILPKKIKENTKVKEIKESREKPLYGYTKCSRHLAGSEFKSEDDFARELTTFMHETNISMFEEESVHVYG